MFKIQFNSQDEAFNWYLSTENILDVSMLIEVSLDGLANIIIL